MLFRLEMGRAADVSVRARRGVRGPYGGVEVLGSRQLYPRLTPCADAPPNSRADRGFAIVSKLATARDMPPSSRGGAVAGFAQTMMISSELLGWEDC